MKVKIIVSGKEKGIEDLARVLSKSLEKGEHKVTIENCSERGESSGVMIYDRVIVGCAPIGFWKKKTPSDLLDFLKKTKGLMGKKTIVFIRPGLIRNNHALRNVMNDVERLCGAFIENFAILKTKKEAQDFGASLFKE